MEANNCPKSSGDAVPPPAAAAAAAADGSAQPAARAGSSVAQAVAGVENATPSHEDIKDKDIWLQFLEVSGTRSDERPTERKVLCYVRMLRNVAMFKASSIERCLSVISGYLQFIHRAVFPLVLLPSVSGLLQAYKKADLCPRETMRKYFGLGDVRKFCEDAPTDGYWQCRKCYAVVSFFTGVSPSEARAIRLGDFAEKAGGVEVTVRQGGREAAAGSARSPVLKTSWFGSNPLFTLL